MTDHPIAPDLTGDVPRCSRESCPSYRPWLPGKRWGDCMAFEELPMGPGDASVCLPHVRHLKVLSEQKCGGCRHWLECHATPGQGSCRVVRGARDHWESCSRWEKAP